MSDSTTRAAERSGTIARLKGKYAMAMRWGSEAEQADAKREFVTAKIEAFIERTLEGVPPLTDEQRERVASLLMGGDQ